MNNFLGRISLGKLLGASLLAALLLVSCQQDAATDSVSDILQNDGRFGTLSSLLGEGELQSLAGRLLHDFCADGRGV